MGRINVSPGAVLQVADWVTEVAKLNANKAERRRRVFIFIEMVLGKLNIII